jgi:hypothetical protein
VQQHTSTHAVGCRQPLTCQLSSITYANRYRFAHLSIVSLIGEDTFSSRQSSDLQFVPMTSDGAASRALFLKQMQSLGIQDWRSHGVHISRILEPAQSMLVDAGPAASSTNDVAQESGGSNVASIPRNIDSIRDAGLHIRVPLSRRPLRYLWVPPFAANRQIHV